MRSRRRGPLGHEDVRSRRSARRGSLRVGSVSGVEGGRSRDVTKAGLARSLTGRASRSWRGSLRGSPVGVVTRPVSVPELLRRVSRGDVDFRGVVRCVREVGVARGASWVGRCVGFGGVGPVAPSSPRGDVRRPGSGLEGGPRRCGLVAPRYLAPDGGSVGGVGAERRSWSASRFPRRGWVGGESVREERGVRGEWAGEKRETRDAARSRAFLVRRAGERVRVGVGGGSECPRVRGGGGSVVVSVGRCGWDRGRGGERRGRWLPSPEGRVPSWGSE